MTGGGQAALSARTNASTPSTRRVCIARSGPSGRARIRVGGDRVSTARPALDRECLVAGHGVHDGAPPADVVAHLHEELAA